MPQASVLNEAKWEAIDEKMILSSHANKTHFNKNGFVPNLVLKEKLLGRLGNGLIALGRASKSTTTSWHRGELFFSPLPLPLLGFFYSVPFAPQMGSTS